MKEEFNPETISLPPELEKREFFTLKQFGSFVGKTSATILRWHKLGYIKVTKFSPRSWMVPKSELERFKNGEMMQASQ